MRDPITSLRLIRRHERHLFSLLFALITLISTNYSLLRSLRNTVVVAGGGAELMPVLELWVGLPSAIFVTWILSRLVHRIRPRLLFSGAVVCFLCAFIAYAYWIYPVSQRQEIVFEEISLWAGPRIVFQHWHTALFFALAELWKVVILALLFWGYVNPRMPVKLGKRLYPPLLLGASLGTLVAGPITVWCTTQARVLDWETSLQILVLVLAAVGVVAIFLFAWLVRMLNQPQQVVSERPCLSLSSCLKTLCQSRYLLALALIVFSDYVAYTLCEVIFLAKVKELFPEPQAYCQHMGRITFWSGFLMIFSALVLGPWLMKRYSWKAVALGTPVAFIVTALPFFAVACWGLGPIVTEYIPGLSGLELAVVLGSLQYGVLRGTKYTLFDSSKELAYVPLSRDLQTQGKLAIDGVGGRFSRATSSVMNMSLFSLFGGVSGAAPLAALLSVAFTGLWIASVVSLGNQFEEKSI